jgi:hypothetical protein
MGDWDLYGNLGVAFENMGLIDEVEVKRICDKRQVKLD